MAFGKPPFGKRPITRKASSRKADQKRRSLLETLEVRHLLTGPQLIGVQPNVGDLLVADAVNVREVSPRELVFRFDDNQILDPTTLAGIRVTRSGGDGTFGLPTAKTDLGSAIRLNGEQPVGGAEVLLTGFSADLTIDLTINKSLTAGSAPQFNVIIGSIKTPNVAAIPTRISVSVGPSTSVGTLVSAINSSPALTSVMRAELRGGLASSLVMADPNQTALPKISIASTSDLVVTPGDRQVGEAPRLNEVTLRFTEELPDDLYRVEVFGFDDPARSVVGLRNQGAVAGAGELFVARTTGSRKDEYLLDLNLGPRVEAVVPQPVVRKTDGRIEQRRSEVVVYFNDDNLFIENDAGGNPTARSAENPRFYGLVLTQESVSNLDDQVVYPIKVVYNPQADTATLDFGTDLANLFAGQAGRDTLRLRVGTSESIPMAPVALNLGGRLATANFSVDAPLTFQSKRPAQNVTIDFKAGTVSGVTVVADAVVVTVVPGQTIADVANLINGNTAAFNTVSVATVVGIPGAIDTAQLPTQVTLPRVGSSATVNIVPDVPGTPGTQLVVRSKLPAQNITLSFVAGPTADISVTGGAITVTVATGNTVADVIVQLLKPLVSNAIEVTASGLLTTLVDTLALPPTASLPSVSASIASTNLSAAATLAIETRIEGRNVSVSFVSGATPGVSVAGDAVTITVAPGETIGTMLSSLAANSAAGSLITLTTNTSLTAILQPASLNASVTLLEIGGTFDTANVALGLFGDGATISRRINSEIDPQAYVFELIGGNDDPAHRPLPETIGGGREQHVNIAFGADTVSGATTLPYNFKIDYAPGRTNTISDRQRDRIREALDLWSDKLGVQFVETPDRGLTIARGDLQAFSTTLGGTPADVYVRDDLRFTARIDPRLASPGFDTGTTSSVLVLDSLRTWQDRYGENFFRTAMAGIGFLLGLEGATDLPANTLMALSNEFLSPAFQQQTDPLPTGPTPSYITDVSTERLEPVFPGNADIIHGQYLYRPESNDVDLYKFEINLNDPDRVGELAVETFAERLPTSSLLDTTVTLYRQVQAKLNTDFELRRGVSLELEALAPGLRGNRTSLKIVVTPSGSSAPQVFVPSDDPNAIIVFTSNPGNVSFKALADAINANPQASKLVRAKTVSGDDVNPANVTLSGLGEDTVLQFLSGGRIEAVSRNDDYYSEDSFLKTELGNGVYYIGVASQGNKFNPVETASGFGGKTQGKYELLVKFRPQVAETEALRDLDKNVFTAPSTLRFPGSRLDGDSDGVTGGVHNFWFQTRALNRQLAISGGDRFVDGQTMTITDARGISRTFEFSTDGLVSSNRLPVVFRPSDSSVVIAGALSTAINSSGLLNSTGGGTVATLVGSTITLSGERSVTISAGVTGVDLVGKTIFVDKDPSAGPQADGTQARPFNNIASAAVANAFGAARAGDIVRIVGNSGLDQNATTLGDNLAYQIGFSTLNSETLEDGTAMEVPQGVTVMVDAGTVFKMRRSYVGLGSTSLLEDRSESTLQVLGTPRLLDSQGRVLTNSSGVTTPGSVYFTSWLDESIGRDTFGPTTEPQPGDWGGILFARELDRAEGRLDLENEGIFAQHVGFADIRYGGGKNIVIDSLQQVVNPIEIIDRRPTIVHNTITFSADAAISASPDSFVETNFQSTQYQVAGQFTSDYDRVGPDIYRNQLTKNSINGMFIRSKTLAGGTLRELTVPGRFDDIDVVHYIAENLVISGTPGSALVNRLKAPVALVTGRAVSGGTLAPGAYTYRVTMVDGFGNESLPSNATSAITITGSSPKGIELASLPPASKPFDSRRLYRSRLAGDGFDLVGALDASDTRFIDLGTRLNLANAPIQLQTTATEVLLHRPDASLVLDPGLIVKLEGARIELENGAQLLAEGLPGLPIVLTSKLDDRFGIGGTLDTNNDNGLLSPIPGDWGGIYVSPTAHLSLDYGTVAYAGGLTRIDGTFKNFSAIELQQGTARITNSIFQDNEDGQGGQGPLERFGRLANSPSTIFARGTQPILVGNTFLRGQGSPLDIDVGSFTADLVTDSGRQTGPINRIDVFEFNYGPLVRQNRFEDNDLNGMEIRGAVLNTESVWDDTDIVHVLYDEVSTGNFHSSSGLRLQSSENASLVVKFAGSLLRPDGRQVGSGSPYADRFGSGLTAFGTLSDAPDRVGGTIQILGRPGNPVVLTSLADDTVGSGLRPDGKPQTDTNNDGSNSRPRANDWRGILIDEYSNDRNVATVLERESPNAVAPGINATTKTAQVLGELAGDVTESDEIRRLGFTLQGVLSEPSDVDTYSFSATAGTEVWADIDYTSFSLDTIIEILNSDGDVLARSDNSTAEVTGSGRETFGIDAEQVGPLKRTADLLTNFTAAGTYDEFGTINPRDAGLRVTLPGVRGSRSVYHVRVRSHSVDINDIGGGLTAGSYTLQLRLQEDQEIGGSTVEFADIRYAHTGVHLRGQPYHSPLLGEVQENESVDSNGGTFFGNTFSNDSLLTSLQVPGDRAQYVGNLLESDRAAISVGGSLSLFTDVDFYQFDVNYVGGNGTLAVPTVLDLDYADEFGRPDMNLSVFYDPDGDTGAALPRLVLFGQDSNIADDRSGPLLDALSEDFLRGSIGTGDPFIGPQILPEGTYYFAVSEQSRLPTQLLNPSVRREPVTSLQRIADDHIESFGGATALAPKVPTFFSRDALPTGFEITNDRSNDFGHGVLTAFDNSRLGNASTIFAGAVQIEQETTFGNNDSRATADNLDAFAPEWSLGFDLNIGDEFGTSTSTFIPHTSVYGTLSGFDVADVYAVNHLGGRFIADIDFASGGFTTGIDTSLIVLDAGGAVVRTGSQNPNFSSSILAGAGGSNSFADPFFVDNALPAGLYFIGVMPPQTTYNTQNGQFERPAPANDQGFVPGTYVLQVSSEGHAVTETNVSNQSLRFRAGSGAPSPSRIDSSAFSLQGYAAADLPTMYFNYFLDANSTDRVTMRIVSDSNPTGTVIASNNGTGAALGDFGSWRQARIDLGQFAGQTGLRLQVEYQDNGVFSGQEGLFLDDFIIGFAERGELITGSLQGDDSYSSSGFTGSVTTGSYQVEIRSATDYTVPRSGGGVTLINSFDTNQRQEESVTFVVPEGNQLADGNIFELGDGSHTLTFEFDDDGSVQLGRIRIPFTTADSASRISASIIQAINSSQVQSVLRLEAATTAGSDSGDPISGGSRINIFGNPTGDFKPSIEQRLSITPGGTALDLARILAGTDVSVSNASLRSGAAGAGTFSGGLNIFGVESGVVLANGDVTTGIGPNASDSTSTTASGVGDADPNSADTNNAYIDTTFGVTTSDSTVLEFDATIPIGSTTLFLQLTFASEEYSEDVTVVPQDIAAIFVDGIAVPVGLTAPSGGASAEISSNTYPSTSPTTTVNDPVTGGNQLDRFGYDGYSFVLRAAATGLDTTKATHRVKIVVADNGLDKLDSALFLSAGSLSTVPPRNTRAAADETGRVVFPSIVSGGLGDQNLRREQGQIIVQNSTFTEITAYGVWAEPGTRRNDPEDDRQSILLENPQLGPTSMGAVRNLRALNDQVIGGMVPGAVIQNNVFDNAGVSAVHIAGEIRPWMISPFPNTANENQNPLNLIDTHFGDGIRDGTIMIIEALDTRVIFEFENLASPPGGNGVQSGHVPIYYRTDRAPAPYNGRQYGYNEFEVVHAMRDAILGSILVTNGLVQLVDPIVGPSLNFPSKDGIYGFTSDTMTFSHPALFIHGASQVFIDPTAPFILEQAPVYDAPQPFARVVNNTIYGTDGNLGFTQTASGVAELDDTLPQAIDTRQGRTHNPVAYMTTGAIGANVLSDRQDVDYYSFSLDVGDRVQIDLDTTAGLDAAFRLFNSRGEPIVLDNPLGAASEVQDARLAPNETASSNLIAPITATDTTLSIQNATGFPRTGTIQIGTERIAYASRVNNVLNGLSRGLDGTTPASQLGNSVVQLLAGIDPYIDYRASEKGIYYVAVSSVGNTRYDPFSLADRNNGTSTGDYDLSINVLAPRTFVLSPSVNIGGNITISQVADVRGQQTNSVTLNLDNLPGIRPWDKAAALADLINLTARTLLRNDENGNVPGGINGPITRVEAAALGGPDGDVPEIGVTGVVTAPDLKVPSPKRKENGGVPDNYVSVIADPRTPIAAATYLDNIFASRLHHAGGNPPTDFNDLGFGHDRVIDGGLGTSELFVWVRNAVSIDISGATGLLMDPVPTANGDQLLPQHGVIISGGASPTLLNNVILNTHGAVMDEGIYVGSVKPGQVVVGGSVFQGTDNRNDRFRIFSGATFPPGPSNVNASQDDFNLTSADNLRLVENPEGGNYLPSDGSFVIDSSIDSLLERDAFKAFKEAIGLSPSPILVPTIDNLGQLRSDDPNVASPSGLGGDVFKDRGAIDRADFVGPVAELLTPRDNDSLGRDQDPAVSVVELDRGVVKEIRIRLQDLGDAADPFVGLGVDDTSVVGRVNSLRDAGAAITVFENNRLMTEGIDYVFSYDFLTDQIILTPVAGIFRPNSIYRIELNHRNRFVVTAPTGSAAIDGLALSAIDSAGGRVLLEFDAGYQLQLPEDVRVQIPAAGGGAGGILDGSLLTIDAPAISTTLTADLTDISLGLISVVSSNDFPATGTVVIENELISYIKSGTQLQIVTRAFNSTTATAHRSGVSVILDAAATRLTFEFDDNNDTTATNIRVPFRAIDTQQQIAERLATAVRTSAVGAGLPLRDVTVTEGSLLLTPSNNSVGQARSGVVVAKNGPLTLPVRALSISVSATYADGDAFVVNDGLTTQTFELDSDGNTQQNRIPIVINGLVTAQALALQIAQSLRTTGLRVSPSIIGGKTIFLGLDDTGSASVISGIGLTVGAVSRPIQDGQQFELTFGSRRYDLNDASATTEPGFVAVPASQVYTASSGYGWTVATTSTSDPTTSDRLLSDGHIGVASTDPDLQLPTEGTFRVNVDPTKSYSVIVRLHDSVIRDQITITANGAAVPGGTNLAVPAGETRAIRFPLAAGLSTLDLKFSAPFGKQFVVNSIEVLELSKVVEFSSDANVTQGALAVPFLPGESSNNIALKLRNSLLAAAIDLDLLALTPEAYGSLLSLGGTVGDRVELLGQIPLSFVLGTDGLPSTPQTQSGTSLVISGPLLLQMPAVGGVAITDGSEFTIINNGITVKFELDVDGILLNPQNTAVPYGFSDSPDALRDSFIASIAGAGLGLTPTARVGGIVELGNIPVSSVIIPTATPITARPGTVSDAEKVTLQNGTVSRTFEFESLSAGGGITLGNIQITFDPSGSANTVATSLAAAINVSDLGLTAIAINNQIRLVDTPQTRIDVSQSRSVQVSGVPGGAIPVRVVNSPLFTPEDVKSSIITAVNRARTAGQIDLVAADRGGDTFFLEGASTLGSELPSYFLRAIQDQAGNFIKPNQNDNSVRFSILLPEVSYDFGDAPDPVGQVAGRYPTRLAFDGARHIVTDAGPRLGSLIDAEPDGQPAAGARGDDLSIQVLAGPSSSGQVIFSVNNAVGGVTVGSSIPATPAAAEGATLTVTLGSRMVTFEIDSDGQFIENHIRIPFDALFGTSTQLAASLRATLAGSTLQLADVIVNGSAVTVVSDDEDGVVLGSDASPTKVLFPGGSVRAIVTTTGPGLLSVWMDYNFDGDWNDPGERVLTNLAVPVGVSSQEVVFTLPAGAATPADPLGAPTFARVRISTAGSLEPTGLALDGEVEDYAVRVVSTGGGFTAVPDQYSVAEDNSLPASSLRNVLSNDAPRPGNLIAVFTGDTGIRNLPGGTLNLSGNGTFTFEPNPNFFGEQTFTYRLVDQSLLSATGDLLITTPTVVTIRVAEVNDAPRRRDDPTGVASPYPVQFTVPEDQAATFTVAQVLTNFNGNPNDDILPGPAGTIAPFDESGQTLRLQVIGGSATGQGGTVQILPDGSLNYTPPANYSGPDSFRLRVQDNGVPQRTIELNVGVFVVTGNDPPTISNRSFSTNEDVPLVVPVSGGLLQGATDPDGDSALLRVSAVDKVGTRGSVTFDANGSFTYTPEADFNGTDEFRYTVTDAVGGSSTRTVTITIAPVPDAPRVGTQPLQTLNLQEDGLSGFVDLTQAFKDPDGDSLTYLVTSILPTGKVTSKLTGPLLEVTPLANQSGVVRVVITASDGDPTTADFPQTLTVNINGNNDAPVLIGSGLPDRTVGEDEIIAPIDLSQFFSDPDGDTLQYRIIVNTNSGLVTPTISGGSLNLGLAANLFGTAVISLEATDGTLTASDQFTLTVNSLPDAPTAAADSYTVSRGGVLDGNVLVDQSRTVVSGSGTRVLKLNDATQLFAGMTIKGTANSIKTVSVLTGTVTLVNNFVGNTITFTGALLANDSDADQNNFSLVAIRINGQDRLPSATPFELARGTLEFVSSTGLFRYLNNGGDVGQTDVFEYVLEDTTGLRSVGTVTLRIGEALPTHQNQSLPFGDPKRGIDVSGDGDISPIDALLVINLLNANLGRTSIPVRELLAPPAFVDVNGDGFVTPIDALLVINELNRRLSGGEPNLPNGFNTAFSSTIVGNNLPPATVLIDTTVTEPPTPAIIDDSEALHRAALESAIDWMPEELEKDEEDALFAVDAVFDSLSLD